MNLLSVDIVISHDFSSHLISCFSLRGVPKCVRVCHDHLPALCDTTVSYHHFQLWFVGDIPIVIEILNGYNENHFFF